jgi:hypothetical protein
MPKRYHVTNFRSELELGCHEFYFDRIALARIAADSPQRSEDLERKAGIAPKSEDEMKSA